MTSVKQTIQTDSKWSAHATQVAEELRQLGYDVKLVTKEEFLNLRGKRLVFRESANPLMEFYIGGVTAISEWNGEGGTGFQTSEEAFAHLGKIISRSWNDNGEWFRLDFSDSEIYRWLDDGIRSSIVRQDPYSKRWYIVHVYPVAFHRDGITSSRTGLEYKSDRGAAQMAINRATRMRIPFVIAYSAMDVYWIPLSDGLHMAPFKYRQSKIWIAEV